eukprot:scaffold1505_cov390-Prasinococcus_capsulatus_cf.AAC.13
METANEPGAGPVQTAQTQSTLTAEQQAAASEGFNMLFSTRRPRDAAAGVSSGLKSIVKGVIAGAATLVAAPVMGAQQEGLKVRPKAACTVPREHALGAGGTKGQPQSAAGRLCAGIRQRASRRCGRCRGTPSDRGSGGHSPDCAWGVQHPGRDRLLHGRQDLGLGRAGLD